MSHQTSAVSNQAPGASQPDWRTHGACRGATYHDLWFSVGTSRPAYQQELQAKQVCNRCPVRPTCLAWALDERIEFGVIGGKSEKERRDMIRRGDRKAARLTAARQAVATTFETRDLAIARLAESGLLPSQIAMRLGVSEKTVRRLLLGAKEPAA